MDEVVRNLQGAVEKAEIVRFRPLPMRMGMAWLTALWAALRKVRDVTVSNVVEFYIPNSFRKQTKWTPPSQRGKLIEFYQPAKKTA